ncbi:N-acetyl-gamma-glutamyl-phosphate reductase [Serinibacter arcticus]|uniref:N-acetyl-gamma-glutamyl-phosphate reductase n=1 Tax=Serinibacter arcticus TaxID=1655435 RepID=A0A2U1ZSN5_9MICO|nr:N-acetyl-gamma-glutamyl-phosphate reductase [Serinibacter arcticus]PWD49998.1 N-acetyl-gamma-glutamyl-phosphate reductase [Serinibacter arcticus]
MRVTVSVAIAGASGYAGGEIARLVLAHPELELGALTAHSNAGESVGAHQPHLAAHPAVAGRRFAPTTAEELAGHDVVVLALPHGASGAVAAELERSSPGCLVVDVGADHRLVDPQAWRDYYGSEHAGTWTYGMPELLHAGETTAARQRAELAGTRRIAVPGCNVTAVTLALQPGIAAGLIEVDDVVAVLAVGYSGAGKAPKTHLLAAEAHGSLVPYGVGGTHRHVPEILQNFGVTGASGTRLSFTPVLVPTSRGILATVTARVKEGVTEADLRAAWDVYERESFVHVLPAGQWPTSAATVGANTVLVQLAHDVRAGRVVVTSALDNLVKGTAGAAVQSLNLALGLPETAGLPITGVAP